MKLADITKEDFQAYEGVRQSGVVNMHDNRVQILASISVDVHVAIIEHYDALNKKWPEVRQS
ncbi:hypothetical protein LCGC14_0382220 [marine sediment metagenome]|uniref:Uncharacterized protein n=1 Tax=marine sediment metagenome TaxID=412755 RepID=A0A0F9WAP4_9ZZZZ